ncbi:AfsA-related hotdog domain-containing protein [Streptomyces sp. NPDC006733]|uniref:AfsA-related hotdog domain-containing protein n=1 Tax=Streptomyces sp. NPDC006733 TaxID=3155460 RepID=UPI0033E7883B
MTITSPTAGPAAATVGRRSAPLCVDVSDPFFFDHPLDHVPGMLLAAGLLGLVREESDERYGAGAAGRLRISLTFDRLCAPDREVLLHCSPVPSSGGPRWRATAEQDGVPVCTALIGLDALRAPGEPAPPLRYGGARRPAPTHQLERADARLVHRQRPENVLLGAPRRTGGAWAEAAVLLPPPGHRLSRTAGGAHAPEALIESARQMSTLLGHVAHEREPDAQMLWVSLDADLPLTVPAATPLSLRWDFAPRRGRRADYDLTLAEAGSDVRIGRVALDIHTVSRARYLERRGI